jgi:hypothetical protein
MLASAPQPHCVPPPNYQYDQQRDDVRLDEQGNLFTALPTNNYVPVVAQVSVISNGESCQSIKSTDALVTSTQVKVATMPPPSGAGSSAQPTGIPDGKYLAWAIVDPAADVYPMDPATGLGPQKYGWYQHYLVVYLDGGYLPTTTSANGPEMVTQTLFVPSRVPGMDKMGQPTILDNADPGSGYDVLEAKRGDSAYSPLCRIKTFVPPDPAHPVTDAAAISGAVDTNTFIYCLQMS